jgi:hypothetical protein
MVMCFKVNKTAMHDVFAQAVSAGMLCLRMLFVLCAPGAWLLLLPFVAGHPPSPVICMASTKFEEALQQRCLPCFSTQPCQEGSAYSCASCIATWLPQCSRVPAPAWNMCVSGWRSCCAGLPCTQLCWLGASGVVWSCAFFK